MPRLETEQESMTGATRAETRSWLGPIAKTHQSPFSEHFHPLMHSNLDLRCWLTRRVFNTERDLKVLQHSYFHSQTYRKHVELQRYFDQNLPASKGALKQTSPNYTLGPIPSSSKGERIQKVEDWPSALIEIHQPSSDTMGITDCARLKKRKESPFLRQLLKIECIDHLGFLPDPTRPSIYWLTKRPYNTSDFEHEQQILASSTWWRLRQQNSGQMVPQLLPNFSHVFWISQRRNTFHRAMEVLLLKVKGLVSWVTPVG